MSFFLVSQLWLSAAAADHQPRVTEPIAPSTITRTAWIHRNSILTAGCAAFDVPEKFIAYVNCRNTLKKGIGTSIRISEESNGIGVDSHSRTDVTITFPEGMLKAGKWTLPAPGLRLLFSNCERSWPPAGGCFVSSRASGTLEVQDVRDGRATILLDAIFIPDRSGPHWLKATESSEPAPERFAIVVRAQPTTAP